MIDNNDPRETRTIAGRTVEMRQINEFDRTSPSVGVAEAAIDAAGAFEKRRAAIANDRNLSETGKAAALALPLTEAVTAIAGASAQLDDDERAVNQREAELLRVPRLDPGASAYAAEDREVRDWWRSLDTTERSKMLQAFNDGPEYRRVEIALLRSPLPLDALELRSVRENWNRDARLNNPAEALAIDKARRAIVWAREALAHTVGVVSTLPGIDRKGITTALAVAGKRAGQGAGVFGVSEQDIKRVLGG